MNGFLQDLRHGLRTFSRRPGYAALVVLTLALGIGANSAVFSVVSGVLLRPLPYPDGEELVVLHQDRPRAGVTGLPFSIHEVRDLQRSAGTLESVVEHHTMSFNLIGRGEPEQVVTGVVSAGFFDVLGIRPAHGRAFLPGDDDLGAEAVLVLSHEYWQRSHGGDPEIVGKVFQMNDRAHTVVGVLPPFPQYPTSVDVYMPTSACPFRAAGEERNVRTAFRALTVFGRTRDGMGPAEVRSDLDNIAAGFRREYPDVYPDTGGYDLRAAGLYAQLTDDARPTLLILLATAGFVLLIVCANVANLTLARLLRRQREIALRAALGASGARLFRQQVTESVLLALAGGALGLLLAWPTLGLLVDFAARFTPRAHEIRLDGPVLAFTLVLALAAGVVAGGLPSFGRRRDITAALREGGDRGGSGGHQRTRGALVVAQVAVSFVLLVGAGLTLRSLGNLQAVDTGFRGDRVLTMQVALDFTNYGTGDEVRGFFRELLPALDGHPSIESAAVVTNFPLGGGLPTLPLYIESQPSADPDSLPVLDFRAASSGYFGTVGVPVLAGRDFRFTDTADAPAVAIINRTMAESFWPHGDPLGDRISGDGQSWSTIVGVVGDVKQNDLQEGPRPEAYIPFEQGGFGRNLVVAMRDDSAAVLRAVRGEIDAIDPNVPLAQVSTLQEVRSGVLASPRLISTLLGTFAGLAVAVTLAGIAGLIAFSVNQRTREIGIRVALGAERGRVLAMVLRQGLGLMAVGLGLGLVAAFLASRALGDLLFQVDPLDPLTFVLAVALFVAVGLAACAVPARRAARIDPLDALREE